MNSQAENSTLIERIERLERQNRTLKTIGVPSALLMATVLVMGQASPNRAVRADTVTAREFVLTDSAGKVRADLGMREDLFSEISPELRILSSKGIPQVIVSDNDKHGPHVALINSVDGSCTASATNATYVCTELFPAEIDVLGSVSGIKGATHIGTLRGIQLESDSGLAGITATWIAVQDKEGFQTRIGQQKLQTVRTGESHETSAASVVLTGKDGKVLWSAP